VYETGGRFLSLFVRCPNVKNEASERRHNCFGFTVGQIGGMKIELIAPAAPVRSSSATQPGSRCNQGRARHDRSPNLISNRPDGDWRNSRLGYRSVRRRILPSKAPRGCAGLCPQSRWHLTQQSRRFMDQDPSRVTRPCRHRLRFCSSIVQGGGKRGVTAVCVLFWQRTPTFHDLTLPVIDESRLLGRAWLALAGS
jgi:hypothetical protein